MTSANQLQSGRRSETTLSSFEEAHTPSPSHEFPGFNFDLRTIKKSVEGPRGPHLFRASLESSMQIDEEEYMTMSPTTPRPSSRQRAAMEASSIARAPELPRQEVRHRHFSSLTNAVEELPSDEIKNWTPRQVAKWMYDAGFEPSIVEKFEENDISGEILITLKFEDLRELDIPSFGQRHRVWNEIHVLRGSAPSTPKPPTPIDETASPCVEFCPSRHHSRRERSTEDCGSDEDPRPHHKSSKRRHRKRTPEDVISPLESVSIVGIEQLMPKTHKCAKGENCSKWRKQQRLIENFQKDHPVSPQGGTIWIAGNPGNPLTAESMQHNRPISDAVVSIVASSDVLGPGSVPAFRHLEEASLRNVQRRDPQENVKQFIQFQHMDPNHVAWSSEEPPTPPYEMFPAIPNPHAGLRGLPRLAIPPPRPVPPPRSASANAFSPHVPHRMERVEAMSPDLRTKTQSPSVYRFGSPFSDMDVPLTAINLGPVARDVSQSVPPNMSYRHAPAPLQRSQSRTSSRRPSFPVMSRVDENVSTVPPTQLTFHASQIALPRQQSPNYPWSAAPRADGVAHEGMMKKRKTKLLRHEWHQYHFTLEGTRLSMHKDASALSTLEYIDVDDYAVACSSLASGSKLNAAFKAMNISRGKKEKEDVSAFAFQLIPAAIEKGQRLKKKEMLDGGTKSKTHYFAVTSRDERIDWMRELMLAKALKQKSEGYEVMVSGPQANMI